MRTSAAVVVVCLGAAAGTPARAQDWTTGGYDAQRSSWVRVEGKISADNLRKPGFKLLWTLKVADAATRARALSPVLIDLVIGHRGFRALGFVGGASDHLVAIDTDVGRMEWERRFAPGTPPVGGSPPCAREMTPSLARPTNPALPALVGGGGGPRAGQPARSAVGDPGQGAVILAQLDTRRREAPPAPAKSPGPRPSPRPFPVVYALSNDGMLRTLNVMNGADAEPPIPFLPPQADARGLIVVDEVAYVATTGGCGEAPDAIWALDLGAKQVTTWRSRRGIAGSVGPAIGPDGMIYVATSDGQLVALEPRTLAPKGAYRSGATAFVSSPVIFEHRGRLLIAASSRDGRIRLFDSRSSAFVGTSVSSRDAAPAADALASWSDTDGTRWLLEPAARGGGVVSWQVVQQDSLPTLRPGWVSREIAAPLAPAVVNGVIFVLSRGAQSSSPAVLYALDGVTGKELWNSGTAMPSFARAAVSAGGSQVYVLTDDGAMYGFGFPMEH